MSRGLKLVIVWALVALVAACGSDSENNANSVNNTNNVNSTNNTNNVLPLPDEAFSWELPTGATEVEWSEYEAALAAGTHTVTSKATALAQRAASDAQEAEDDQTIQEFLSANPTVELNLPTELPGADPDGNARVSWTNAMDETSETTLLGLKWSKSTLARAIREYPTRENQLGIYESFYPDLPADVIGDLGLPTPAEIQANPAEYDAGVIQGLVESIAGAAASIVPAPVGEPIPAARPEDCDNEIRTGTGGDRNFGELEPSPDSLWAQHQWKDKWYTTCIKNQAVRGTCVAMSSVSAIEMLVAKEEDRWVNLSEQWIYHQMKYVWAREDYGDGYYTHLLADGLQTGNIVIPYEDVWNYNPAWSRTDGVVRCQEVYCGDTACSSCANDTSWWYYLDSCNGYTETCGDSTHQSNLICAKAADDSYHCAFEELPELNPLAEGYASDGYTELWDHKKQNLSFANILISLAIGNPVVIGVPIYQSFYDADSNRGFVPLPDPANGDVYRGAHAMHVLAFVDNDRLPANAANPFPDGEGGGWFIVKNSWGTHSGDGGYVYIPANFIRIHILDAVSFHNLK